MNQEELINAVTDKFFLSKAETREIIKYVLDRAVRDLKQGERVYIRNFGALHKVKRKKKRIRNIKTGKMITIPERETVEFRPASALLKKISK